MFGFGKKATTEKQVNQRVQMIKTLLFQTVAGQTVSRDFSADLSIKEGYKMASIAYACINKISKAVASTNWKIVDKTTGKDLSVPKLTALLARPNPITSGNDFIESFCQYYLITGESYITGTQGSSDNYNTTQPPKEMYIMPSQLMSVKTGNTFLPSAYEYTTGKVTKIYPVDQVTGKSQAMQLKTLDPNNSFRGMSPMQPAAHNIDIFNEGNKWNKALLDNGGRPSGAIQYKSAENGTLSEDQFNRLQNQIDEQISGADNAGKPLLLEGGLEWVELSLSPKDMDFSTSMLSAARQVASVYNVPPQLVNIPGESTYSNYEQAALSFWIDNIIPFTQDIIEAFNWWLAPTFGDNVKLILDIEAIPALDVQRAKKMETLDKATFMTFNEKRAAIGLEPVEGGDVLFVNSGNIPLDFATDSLSDVEFTKALNKITEKKA